MLKCSLLNLASFAQLMLQSFMRVVKAATVCASLLLRGLRRWWQCHPWDGGAWRAAAQGVRKSRTRLSDFTFTFHFQALEKALAATPVLLPGNPMDGGAWWAGVYGVTQSRTRLSDAAAAAFHWIGSHSAVVDLWGSPVKPPPTFL